MNIIIVIYTTNTNPAKQYSLVSYNFCFNDMGRINNIIKVIIQNPISGLQKKFYSVSSKIYLKKFVINFFYYLLKKN